MADSVIIAPRGKQLPPPTNRLIHGVFLGRAFRASDFDRVDESREAI